MNAEPFDLKDAVAELIDAMAPFASLAESMGNLENSYRLQTDLMIIDKFYTEADRQKIFEQIDVAWCSERDALETMGIIAKRGEDLRTFEQYVEEHGEIVAKKAFSSTLEALSRYQAAGNELAAIRMANPLIARVHTYIKEGV